jgi:hypothetical protein
MARSTADIQAEIAVTRGLIEHRLDDLHTAVADRWWLPAALALGGVAAGMILSRVSLLRLLSLSMRTMEAGLSVASALAALRVFTARRRRGV